ncbi:dTDP-4-dehydrorhamnose reductase [Halioxenophilus aromaticivorans]|uniref:dTDP-4-dehydrorhamnose reductase n=1 Tax=Halioxenophilus aromaticivorans TaxID=1306992 RepID=A0AAV3U7P6_9ALTE
MATEFASEASLKILIFGHNGQVGSSLVEQLNQQDQTLICPSRTEADFAHPEQVTQCIESYQPDVIVNACAYTAVDKAESDQATADAVNHLSVAAMAQAALAADIPVIHISTDYVFPGDAKQPYLEDDATGPHSVYGQTKLDGDLALANTLPKQVTLRTSWVFGEYGNNFVKTMLRLAESRDELNVVADQHGKPTYAGDIVTSILAFLKALAEQKPIVWGTYHCSSAGETTWHGFAEAIFAEAKSLGVISKTPKVHPIPSSDFPTPAPRPAYSVLNTDKLNATLAQPLPHWSEGLHKMLRHLQQG